MPSSRYRWYILQLQIFRGSRTVSKDNSYLPRFGVAITLALLKAQVSLQLGNVSSSDNGVSVSIMYSYTY